MDDTSEVFAQNDFYKKINFDEFKKNYYSNAFDRFIVNHKLYLEYKQRGELDIYYKVKKEGLLLKKNVSSGSPINSSTLAILVNLNTYLNSSFKEKFFGTGLGSYNVIKKKYINNFYIPGSHIEKHYLDLGNKDGKFILNRAANEIGILSFIFIFILIFFYFKSSKKYYKSIYLSIFLYLILKTIHHGTYLQMELYVFICLFYYIKRLNDFHST